MHKKEKKPKTQKVFFSTKFIFITIFDIVFKTSKLNCSSFRSSHMK